MRITRLTPRENTAPYNKIFEAFGDATGHIIAEVFAERLDIIPEKTYVRMPKLEEQITGFALSGSQDVGLVVGEVGIGKSSVLKYLREAPWSESNCLILFKDFSSQNLNTDLPEKYYTLSLESQKHYALLLARKHIRQMIKSKIYTWLQDEIEARPMQFCNFIASWHHEINPLDSIFSRHNPEKILSNIYKKNPDGFMTAAFHYYLVQHKIEHIKFIADNLDGKDILVLQAFMDLAAQTARSLQLFNKEEIGKDRNTPRRWMTILMACRPHTEFLLKNKYRINGHNWFGTREFVISEPCSLGEAALRRYNHLIQDADTSTTTTTPKRMEFNSGSIRYEIADKDRFFEKIIEVFIKSHQDQQILMLNNNSVAFSIKQMGVIVRNIHFVEPKKLFSQAFVVPSTEDTVTPFTSTTVVRALAYGNQGRNIPIYPVNESPVVNLLESEKLPFGASTFKARVVQALIGRNGNSSPEKTEISVNDFLNFGDRYFELTNDRATSVLDELYAEGVIGHRRSLEAPSKVGPDCSLYLQPRGRLLWQLLGENSILLQCYRDSCFLDEDFVWDGQRAPYNDVATLRLPLEIVPEQLLWMIRQFWKGEESEMNIISGKSYYSEFKEIFGSQLITERLLASLESSVSRFYKVNSITSSTLVASIGSLRSRVAKVKSELT